MPTKRPRDFQRSKVYRAEWGLVGQLLAEGDSAARPLDEGDALDFLADVWNRWPGRLDVTDPPRLRYSKRMVGALYHQRKHEITLGRGGANRLILVHECVHAAQVRRLVRHEIAAHGFEFTAAYKEATERFLGFNVGQRLRKAMRQQGAR
jgi:hypothetical protein